MSSPRAAAGATATTDADGRYRFEVPAGPLRLRWSADLYETRDSDVVTARAGDATTLETVTLRLLVNVPIPEWTISGTVVDSLGQPVAGATLLSALGVTVYASGQADSAGNFLLRSTRQHPDPIFFEVSKAGYERATASVACPASCAATLRVRMRRIIQEYLDAPATLSVGEIAPVDHVQRFDDGSTSRHWTPALVSSAPNILQRLDTAPPYEHVYVKALAPGTAILTMGTGLPTPVRVVP